MQSLPHRYTVTAAGVGEGDIDLATERVPHLRSASPAEFDGPGDRWSPETLLVGAVGDCFVLTFRAVARASKLPWTSLQCQVTGTLDRIDRVTQFTGFDIRAQLSVPAGVDPDLARRLLDKAEGACLVSRSLKAATHLTAEIEVAAPLVPTIA
jgi:organic hydroperoxide reductase OsmC/OhrA